MASRSLSTKISVEGDQKYKSALSVIDSELKKLKSDLALTTNEFQNNANSEEALTRTGENLASIFAKETEKYNLLKQALDNARNSQETFRQRMTESAAALEKGSTSAKELEETIKKDKDAYAQLESQLNSAKQRQEELKSSENADASAKKQVADEIKALKERMAELDTQIKNETEKLTELQGENASVNKELNNSTTGYENATKKVNEYQTKLNDEQVTLNNLNQDIKNNQKYLDEAKNSTDKTATSIDKFGKEVKETAQEEEDANKETESLSDGFSQLSGVLATIGITEFVNKITDAFKECVDAASDFEYSMATVEAVSGATDEQLGELEEQAEEWAGSSIFLAQDIADTYTTMGRAGWNAEEMLDGMNGVMNLAAASGEDLTDVTTIVTTALSAFGEEASESGHFADVLAEAAADSNTNVAQLGEAFQAVGTTAGTLNYSIDDVATALSAMANNGLRGQMAGTALATALTRMSGANATATKEMENLGISMYDGEGTAYSLSEYLDVLREAMAGMTQEEKENAAYQLAGQRGMKGLLALINTSTEDWNELSESINNCSGAADEMSNVQLDTYAGDVQLLKSAVEGLEIEVGNQLEPTMRSLVEDGTDIVKKVTEIVNANDDIVPSVTGAAAALGGFATALTVATTAYEVFNTVVKKNAAVMATIAGALAPIAILVGSVVYAYQEWENTLSDSAQESYEAARATKELYNSIEESKTSYEESMSKTEETAADNRDLLASLNELTAGYDDSASSAAEINNVVDQLNTNLPDLGLEFDSVTGKLNMNSGAIEDLIEQTRLYDELVTAIEERDAMKEAMDQASEATQAAADAYADAWNDYHNAEVDGTDPDAISRYYEAWQTASIALQNAQNTGKEASAAYAEASKTVTETSRAYDALSDSADDAADSEQAAADAQDSMNAATQNAMEGTDYYTDFLERQAQTTEDNKEALKEYNAEMGEADTTMRNMRDSFANTGGSASELRAQYEELLDEYEALDGAGHDYYIQQTEQALANLNLKATTAELDEAFGSLLTSMGVNTTAMAQALIDNGISVEEYQETVNSNLDEIKNGFQKYDDDEQVHLSEITSALQSNLNDYNTWKQNAIDAWNMAVDSGDEASMAMVQDIIDMGVEGSTALGELVDGGTEAMEDAATTWGDAASSAMDAATLALAEENGITYDAAAEMMAGGTDAITDAGTDYADAATGAVDATATAVSDEEGAVTDATGAVMTAGATEAANHNDEYETAGEGAAGAIATGITSGGTTVNTAAQTVMTNAKATASAVSFWSVGYNIDTGIVKGLNDGEYLIKKMAKKIIDDAFDEMQTTADSHSPSRRARDKIGKMISAGVAEGITAGIGTVEDASREMVNAALGNASLAQSIQASNLMDALDGNSLTVNPTTTISGTITDTGAQGLLEQILPYIEEIREYLPLIGQDTADSLSGTSIKVNKRTIGRMVKSLA